MTPELKPCPFCGGAPALENEAARKYVYCSVCEADGAWDGDEQTAIDAWNRRTPPEATDSPCKPYGLPAGEHDILNGQCGRCGYVERPPVEPTAP